MLRDLFRTKSLDAILHGGDAPQHQLKRTLGAFDVVMLGIGAIIGAGIFATIGTAAAGDATRAGAGPALILSFVVTGVACGFAALCYAEFAAMVPISGSAYTYSYATLGELVAWIIGWDLIIEYAVGNVAVAISWANYFKTFVAGFGIIVPDWLSTDYRTAAHIPGLFASAPHLFGVPIVFNILAIGIVALITVVLVIGIRESVSLNTAMVSVKLVVLGLFCLVGWKYTKPENWYPFAPNGWAGVQAGAAIVFFAYIGFDAVSTVAEEVRDPKRDLPIGIIGSLIVCTIIYIVVAMVFTGIIPYNVLVQKLATEQAEPLTMALQYANIGKWGTFLVGIVAFGSVVAHTAVLLVFQLGQPRIFFSMARDGLLPQSFAKVHPRFRTPHVTTILTGVAVGVCAMFTSIDEMVDLTNIGTLFAFVLVCIGILILRKRDPDRPRAFRTPWVPLIPVLGVLSCLYLMLGLPWITWVRFGVWLLLGLDIYFLYGFGRSKLRPEAVPIYSWTRGDRLLSTTGRLNRARYFGRVLIIYNVIVVTAVPVFVVVYLTSEPETAVEAAGSVLALLALWPIVCQGVQRLHDLNRHGSHYWLLLVPFYNVYLACLMLFKKGTTGPNLFGADPLTFRSRTV